MPRKTKPFITQIQAEGTKAERDYIRKEVREEALRLVRLMPAGPDRLIFVRNLVRLALAGKVDIEVLRMFLKLTGTGPEMESVLPRAKLTR